jgi:hypothetical protein
MSGLDQLGGLSSLASVAQARWDAVVVSQPGVLLWPLLFAAGAGLAVGFGPRPVPLAERLRRLDLRFNWSDVLERPIDSRAHLHLPGILGELLEPVVADLADLVERIVRRLIPGLVNGERLRRELRLVFPGHGVMTHLRNKALCGGVLGLLPLLVVALYLPSVPLWQALVTAGVVWLLGWMLPDQELRWRLSARRQRVQDELPAICDHLTIALTGSLSVEQALVVVADASAGVLGDELRWLQARMQSGAGLVQGLDELQARNELPELNGVLGALRSSARDGTQSVALVAAQADALRAAARARLLDRSGRASTLMVVPVAAVLLPVLAVVLLVPAMVQLLGGS